MQTQQALIAENQHLRQLLEMRERAEQTSTAAEILYVGRDPFSRKVIVDKGSSQDIEEGAAVVDDTGLIGQVTRVFPWTAEVALITDKEQAVPVQVVRSGLRGVMFGIGYDGALDLRFMPVNADIQNGDVLVTSGIDGIYPPGLPVAVVSNIERNAAYPFARITCTPAAGRQQLRPGAGPVPAGAAARVSGRQPTQENRPRPRKRGRADDALAGFGNLPTRGDPAAGEDRSTSR